LDNVTAPLQTIAAATTGRVSFLLPAVAMEPFREKPPSTIKLLTPTSLFIVQNRNNISNLVITENNNDQLTTRREHPDWSTDGKKKFFQKMLFF
jgi:hypothetical protein